MKSRLLRILLTAFLCGGLPGTFAKWQTVAASDATDTAVFSLDSGERGHDSGASDVLPEIVVLAGPVPAVELSPAVTDCSRGWAPGSASHSRAPPASPA